MILTPHVRLVLAVLTVLWPTLSHARGVRAAAAPVTPRTLSAAPSAPAPDLTLAHMDLGARFASLDRPLAYIWRPREDAMITTLSRQITPYGPVGTLGLIRFDPRCGLDGSALGAAVVARTRSASQRVGVNLRFRFR